MHLFSRLNHNTGQIKIRKLESQFDPFKKIEFYFCLGLQINLEIFEVAEASLESSSKFFIFLMNKIFYVGWGF